MHGLGRVWMGVVGLFFLAWGAWELGEMLGVVPEARFPWPLFILVMGGAFVMGALTGQGWGAMGCGPGERGTEPRP